MRALFPELPGEQRALAEAVLERARASDIPVVVVLFCGRPLIVPWLAEQADALLVAWFPGTEAGNAIADVLTGRVSPSRANADHLAARARAGSAVLRSATLRPAREPEGSLHEQVSRLADSPLFPFGFGLTYGRFAYTNLRVSPESATANDLIEVTVDVTNEGARAAEETVFLFVRDSVASVARPTLELKGVAKIVSAARGNRYGAVAVAGGGAALPGSRPRAGVRARRNRDSRRAVRRPGAAPILAADAASVDMLLTKPGLFARAAALALLAGFTSLADGKTRADCEKEYKPQRGQQGKDVIWAPTADIVVVRMLEMAKVTPADKVYDLGAGDGKIAIAAGKRFGATAVGVEYDPDLAKHAQCLVEAEGVRSASRSFRATSSRRISAKRRS